MIVLPVKVFTKIWIPPRRRRMGIREGIASRDEATVGVTLEPASKIDPVQIRLGNFRIVALALETFVLNGSFS
jgi:uncharacterized protein (DUF934 family)